MTFETQEKNLTAISSSDDYLFEMSVVNLRGKNTCSVIYGIVTSWHLFSFLIISFLDMTGYPSKWSVLCYSICLFLHVYRYLMKLVLHPQQPHLFEDIDLNVQGVQNRTSLSFLLSYMCTLSKLPVSQLQHACSDLLLNI